MGIPEDPRRLAGVCTVLGVPNTFFGIRDFPHLKLGIRYFKAKLGRHSGLKVCAEVER